MRISYKLLFSLALLAHSPLSQSQTLRNGVSPTTCTEYSVDVEFVRIAFKTANEGQFIHVPEVIAALGDGASIDILKLVSVRQLETPKNVTAYLQLARMAFLQPQSIASEEDKRPEVTLFLLDYLREHVSDSGLRDQIESTKQYVLSKTASPGTRAADRASQSDVR